MLIDNGHGLDTPGKRSPNDRFLEATYTREIARRVIADLIDRGYNAELLVPEDNDISLEERVRRVNQFSLTYEPSSQSHRHGRPLQAISPTRHPNVILISIHVNAAGNGVTGINKYSEIGFVSAGR